MRIARINVRYEKDDLQMNSQIDSVLSRLFSARQSKDEQLIPPRMGLISSL
jgi:hypothetical protein